MNTKLIKRIIFTLTVVVLIVSGYLFLQAFIDSKRLVGQWRVGSIEEGGIKLVERSEARIELSNNGTYFAIGGCNEMLTASYKLFPVRKILFQVAGTKKKCPNNAVEFWNLEKVYSYDLLPGNILLLNYKTSDSTNGTFKLKLWLPLPSRNTF